MELKRKRKTQEEYMIDFIKKARSEVDQATCLFNEMTDSAAIDYASYNLLAAKTKYSYLLQIAKDQGLTI